MSFLGNIRSQTRAFQGFDHIALFLLGAATFAVPLFVLQRTRDAYDVPKLLCIVAVVLLTILFVLLKATLTRTIILRRTILDIPAGAFFLVVAASALLSVSRGVSWLGRMDGFVLSVVSLGFLLAFAWLLAGQVRSTRVWRMFIQIMLASGLLACVAFLFRTIPFFAPAAAWFGFNPVASANSAFGMWIAAVSVLAWGLAIDKARPWPRAIFPAFVALTTTATLARLGFRISWILFAVGMGFLIAFASMRMRDARMSVLSAAFFLFLVSVAFIFTETPGVFKEPLPVEVSLGSGVSWTMSVSAVLDTAKSFFFGFGPGSFSYVYSHFRPSGLNAVDVAWSNRFHQPFSVFYALLSETGLLGTLLFLLLALIALGILFATAVRERREEEMLETDGDAILLFARNGGALRPMEVFPVGIAWIATTLGMGIAFYGMSLWFLWWWLLAMMLLGLSAFSTSIMRTTAISLDVSPHYALALSFTTVLFFTAILFFGVFISKVYRAEMAFTDAVRARTTAEQEQALQRALVLRPRMAEYELALAGVYFANARQEADRGGSPDAIATRLAQAVNTARSATEHDPNNVGTWETLSVAYMNARVFAPEASEWAKDSLERAILLEPSNPVFHLQLGILLESAAPDQAEKAYRQAIAVKRDYLPAYNRLAEMYERKNRVKDAINLYQPVIGAVERDADALFSLGRLLYNRNNTGDAALAERAWLQAITISPQHSNALYSLGLLYEKRGERTKALEYYKRVRDLNPNNTDVQKKVRELGGR